MRFASDKYVEIDQDKLNVAISKCNIAKDKLSTMVLNKNNSYIAQSIIRGTFDIEALKKLCSFLNVEYESVIKKSETPLVVPEVKSDDVSAKMETLIVGLNTLYEEQKSIHEDNQKLAEIMTQMLQELKVLNAKQNRLENALGQIVSNVLIVKDNSNKVLDRETEIKSQINLVSGRVKDIIEIAKHHEDKPYGNVRAAGKENEKTYKVVQ